MRKVLVKAGKMWYTETENIFADTFFRAIETGTLCNLRNWNRKTS